MDLDRLKGAWQAQDVNGLNASTGGDMTRLFDRLSALDRAVQRRDVREYVAACLVMAIFGWRAAVTEELLIRIGALIVVFGSMFMIVWSRLATVPSKRQAFTSDLPIAQFCARELEKVEAQVRLSKSVWWWYVAPTVIGVGLMLVPAVQTLVLKLIVAAIVLGFGVAIHYLNVAAARHALEPLRDELRERLTELGHG